MMGRRGAVGWFEAGGEMRMLSSVCIKIVT